MHFLSINPQPTEITVLILIPLFNKRLNKGIKSAEKPENLSFHSDIRRTTVKLSSFTA